MLEQKDLQAIAQLIDERAKQTEVYLFGEMDKRFGVMDKRFGEMDKRFGEMDKRFGEMDKRFGVMDKRFEEIDKRFEEMDKRFEEMDKRFEEMDKRIEKRITASEARLRHEMKELKYGLSKEMNKRIGKSTSRILTEMDKRINKSELLMLDEMERYNIRNEREHEAIIRRLENLESIYRMNQSDSGTIEMILDEMEQLKKRLKVLEEKMAIA